MEHPSWKKFKWHPSWNNNAEWEKLSSDDQYMLLAFRTFTPCLARFPHCIFRASAATLRRVAEVMGAKIGVWGARPLIDGQGEGYLEPEDGAIIDDFVLWELLENQNYALQYEGYGSPDFIMCIDTRTPRDVLAHTYRPCPETEALEDRYCYVYIHLLCDWLEELGWAYVPLGYESDYAMFVTAHRGMAWVEQVESALRQHGHPVARLQTDAERSYWHFPA